MAALKSNFKTAEESLGFLLWKAANRLQRSHARCLVELKVTPAQFSMLTCLVYLSKDGPVTPIQVARQTGMDKMMVSDLVKTLETKKLLVRKPNPNDGRSFLIAPTARGIKITNSAVQKVEAIDAQFFKMIKGPREFQSNLLTLALDESDA